MKKAALTLTVALLMSCTSERSTTTPPPKPTLAVEFPPDAPDWAHKPPRRLPVPVGTEISTNDLNPLPGTDPSLPPLAVALDFTQEGDKVVTSVHVLPPESDPLRWSDGHKRLLATHSTHLNETMELTELKKIGFEPFSLKVVKFVPPPAAHPTLISKVPSIAIAQADDEMAAYHPGLCAVILHNTSPRGVLALTLGQGPQQGSESWTWARGKPVIAPQSNSTETVSCSPQIIVSAALFSDGAVEGDDTAAATLKANQMTQITQSRLITPIIDGILQDNSMNDDARIARIKEEIFHLPSEPDPAMVRMLQSQFPNLPAEAIGEDLKRGLGQAKNELWYRFYPYEEARTSTPSKNPPSLSRLWQDARR